MSKARGPYRVDPLGHKKSQQALDKMAENARELGLDYEPAQQEFASPGGGYVPAIPAQRQALAEQALDKKAENARELGLGYEPLQCPICKAEDYPYPKCGHVTYVEQPAQQEPVAKHYVDGGHLVYPTAQRPWVELTDEELSEIYNQADWDTVNGWEYERAIEAALRSKNT